MIWDFVQTMVAPSDKLMIGRIYELKVSGKGLWDDAFRRAQGTILLNKSKLDKH
ncbi:MAG: hypothetical protein JW860_08250 [Sedimentisphaerales bacterium]|nr:hypothetical protein [Sedimentisphaerales bacterium]